MEEIRTIELEISRRAEECLHQLAGRCLGPAIWLAVLGERDNLVYIDVDTLLQTPSLLPGTLLNITWRT